MPEEAFFNVGLFSTDDLLLKNVLAAQVLHTQLASRRKFAPLINDPPPTDNTPEKQTLFSVQLLTFDLMINLPNAAILIFVMQPPEGSKVFSTLLCFCCCCCYLGDGLVVFCVHRCLPKKKKMGHSFLKFSIQVATVLCLWAAEQFITEVKLCLLFKGPILCNTHP